LPDFAGRPLDIVKVWQGGFVARSGWIAAAAVVLTANLAERKGVARLLVLTGALAFVTYHAITATQRKPDLILPSIDLLTLDGGTEQLAGRAKPVVLNLWATWCPPCRREMPMMTDLAASRSNIDFVFANQGETEDRIRTFLMREGLPFDDMLRDPRQRLMGQMRTIGLPSTLVFDAHGKLVAAQMGEISQAALTEMIAKANGMK
jgi:thiol-disulfide isomerase/thioredoxin